MQVNGANRSSKYLPLCSAEERKSYRFATAWGWVNDDSIFIFGWSIALSKKKCFCIFETNLIICHTAQMHPTISHKAAQLIKF